VSIHPIETESYRLLAGRVDLSSFGPRAAAVAARVVHATAEPSFAGALVCGERAVDAGVAALGTGAPVLCDVEMVRAGITGTRTLSALAGSDAPSRPGDSHEGFPSRTAAAMAGLLEQHPEGAVVVVGCAPTALEIVNTMLERGELRPALVIGTPVGFVGAEDAKARLLEVAATTGVPAIALRGERGGAAVAAAIVNALVRLGGAPGRSGPACLFIGHGTRSARGARELERFARVAAAARPEVATAAGFIEFVEPGLDDALDGLVDAGTGTVVAVPLVLLGAGHLKDDGPAALQRARARHPEVSFSYARELGVDPSILSAVDERARACGRALPGGAADALVVVGRGSSDPDANADLAKAARLLADGRELTETRLGGRPAAGSPAPRDATAPLGLVVPAFVSLAAPGVADALDQCAALGALRIAVVPYFLFDGLLVDRIREQVTAWTAGRPAVAAATGTHIGVDARVVDLAWRRYDEARAGAAHMNCDGCLYRTPLPGYARRVGTRPEP